MPRFHSKTEAEDFVKKYCEIESNPLEKSQYHCVTTLTDWSQIEAILLPKINEYNKIFDKNVTSSKRYQELSLKNRFLNNAVCLDTSVAFVSINLSNSLLRRRTIL